MGSVCADRQGSRIMRRRYIAILVASAGVSATSLFALPASSADNPKRRKPEWGDVAEGTYAGDVMWDSKGASRSRVTLTLTRVWRNVVRVTFDYPRLPVDEVLLSASMGKVIQTIGDTALLLDRAQAPTHLDVSLHNEVSWSGQRR
jgi:hypothetical protein